MAVIVTVVGTNALSGGSGAATGPHSPYVLTVSSAVDWVGFLCILLGWLAAMGGAAHQGVAKMGTSKTSKVQDMRPAA
jgi:hypothetical protein